MGDGDVFYVRATRRATVRELTAGIVSSIVAVTVYSWLTPATIRTGSVDDAFAVTTSASVTLPMMVILLGSFYLGALLWAVTIEHRRPWPFGPLGRIPSPFWRESMVAAFAFWIVLEMAGGVWDETRLHVPDDGLAVWVASPAAVAAGWVAAIAVFGVTFVLATAIAGRNVPRPTILPEASHAR